MTSYRYLFADLRTNQILAELPLTAVSFTKQLNGAGTLQGELLITDTSETAMGITPASIPTKTAIYVDRNGVLVWGGVLWMRDYNSESQKYTFTAREFMSYFERRRITNTLTYTNTDPLVIAKGLISNAQSATGGNIGVQIGGELSGQTTNRTFYNYELKTVATGISDMAGSGSSSSQTGFDYTIDVAYDGSFNPVKTLKLGYPRLGIAYSATNPNAPVFEFPGNIVSYEYPEDGSTAANAIFAVGSGQGNSRLTLLATDTAKLSAGYPLLEDSTNYIDVYDSTLLGNMAAAQVAAVSLPPVTMKVVAPAYAPAPVLGTYTVGDDVRVRINDPRFSPMLDQTMRIMAYTVSPGEDGPERVTLTLTLPQVS